MKYGIFFGRFQPFHLGHQSVIQKIIDDGLTPVILIGSAQEFGTDKNPYSYKQRVEKIQSVFPEIIVAPLIDIPCSNEEWINNLRSTIESITKEEDSIIIYTHNKPSEKGKYGLSSNMFITDLINFAPKVDVSYLCDVNVSATMIRDNMQEQQCNIDPNVYSLLAMYNNHLYRATDQAFRDALRKSYDCIYIFVDLHSTLVKPNYSKDVLPKEMYENGLEAMQYLSSRKDCKLILYSCSHEKDLVAYYNYFSLLGIKFDYINENPEVTNSGYGNYNYKPFYNLLLDDKAGFNPRTDWSILVDSFKTFPIL